MKHYYFEEVNCLFECFSVRHLVRIIGRYWQSSDRKEKRYSADIRVTQHFLIYGWVFPLGYIEDKWFVNYGGFYRYCRSIHGMISVFRCSEDKESLFEVISDKLILMEEILFKWLALISLIVFQMSVLVRILLIRSCCWYKSDQNSCQRMW